MLKLNLGCGDLIMDGWVNIDLYAPKADLKCDIAKLPYGPDTVDEMYSCHTLEHFDYFEGFDVLKEWHRVLRPGGILKIETPDLLLSCKEFPQASEYDKINKFYPHFYGLPWLPGGAHKFLYTESQLRWTLEKVGFRNMERVAALRYIGKESICLGMLAVK
jgi:predicted SAM-dependent methyltransferase